MRDLKDAIRIKLEKDVDGLHKIIYIIINSILLLIIFWILLNNVLYNNEKKNAINCSPFN